MAVLFDSLIAVRKKELALAGIEGGLGEIQLLKGEADPTLDSEEARLLSHKEELMTSKGDFDSILSDEDLKSVAGPPIHEINHTSYIGTSSNIGSLKEGYLCNHEEFNRETGCYRFSAQEGVQENWNRPKKFRDQEGMNFTIQRFLSPSICEYATLEEDSSPKRKRPEPKPIVGVKRSLLSFHKDQDI
ncbi:hypothetical protein DY000_02050221 [Brassica cretica]|uniref:Uncharacterized protein n=1 Tax=Brassica cretica TaxID=69181 RepID=A0ABQ7EXZ2_BRACR|nr:hypothetical protein DY000_02050221 [Brassica cretica]